MQRSTVIGDAGDRGGVINTSADGTHYSMSLLVAEASDGLEAKLTSEKQRHPDSRGQKQRPSPDSIDHQRSEDCSSVIEDLENSVDQCPRLSLGHTNRNQDRVEVVRNQTITGLNHQRSRQQRYFSLLAQRMLTHCEKNAIARMTLILLKLPRVLNRDAQVEPLEASFSSWMAA